MKKGHMRLAFALAIAAALLGCAKVNVPRPETGYNGKQTSMPPLESPARIGRLAPVFGPPQEYAGSRLPEVGRRGLFEVHDSKYNRIAVLKNGDESFSARVQLLESAQKSIQIQAFIFWGDESGVYIADLLKKKKAEGLDVRVIVDASANLGWQTQWMYFDLKQHGIEVQGYESLYLEWLNEIPIPVLSPAKDPEAPNHRYHEKIWIVDGETDHATAVVGGLNIANEYFRVGTTDPDDFWRDQDIIVQGSIVADIAAVFNRNFDHLIGIKKSRGLLDTDIYWQKTREFLDKYGKLAVSYRTRPELVERVENLAGAPPTLNYVSARCRFFHSRPRLDESYIWQAYRKLFQNAEREIIVCNGYFIPSSQFVEAVREAAARGVRVIVLTNSPDTNDLPELSMVGRGYYKKILSINEESETKRSGGSVQVWEWLGWRYDREQRTEGSLHAKYAVFDRRYSLVGSYNLDPRSEKLNSETAVVFESEKLSTDLARMFYENDLAYSRRVTLQDANEFQDPGDALYKLRKEFGGLFESLL